VEVPGDWGKAANSKEKGAIFGQILVENFSHKQSQTSCVNFSFFADAATFK
jgi:hypothetical protein